MKRAKIRAEQASYFASPTDISFCRTGCTILDLALGGGWALGRVANIIGSQSSGKTLLAIEASTNFARQYPEGSIQYREVEAAFDKHYAAALGMPLDRIDFNQSLQTVEDMFVDLEDVIKRARKPVLYVVDSLDALSDAAESARKFDKASYGMDKAKALSELFRRINAKLSQHNVTLLIISQVRMKTNAVPFGKQWVRSGGRALDFYASQVVYLSQSATVKRTISGVKRTTGIVVSVSVEKNKISLPFRKAEFEIVFGSGIDDNKAMVSFLDNHGGIKELGMKSDDLLTALRRPESRELRQRVKDMTRDRWYRIEDSFLPKYKKYHDDE